MSSTSSANPTEPTTTQQPTADEEEYDEVSYLHNLYYGQIDMLKARQEVYRLIVEDANPESNAYAEAKYQLDKVTTELDKLYSLMQTVCTIEAFNTIKKSASSSTPESSINNQPI